MATNCLIKKIVILFSLGYFLLNIGCKKLIEIDPPATSISGQNVYSTDATAISVLNGVYTLMSQTVIPDKDQTSIGFLTGLSSDELTLFSGSTSLTLLSFYQNTLGQSKDGEIWNIPFSRLFIINSAIENLSKPTGITEKVRLQLLGEAKFMRAFCFFYLVNLYGDVPLIVSSDYTINSVLPRSPKNLVWNQIISDLKDAKNLLSSNYMDGTLLKSTTERVRPTKWAATALLARSYLYIQDWKDAELQASSVIEESSKYSLDSLNAVFLKNSKEAIWQLQPVLSGWNTEDAKAYIIPASYGPNGAGGVSLSNQLLNSFESGDLRKQNWTDTVTFAGTVYSFAYKYKLNTYGDPVNEYNTILRLGEQYLIRSEARAQQNNINGALEDLNTIRNRAGLKNTTASTPNEVLSAILHERQVELFTEWGHRWLDLKRTNTANQVMSIVTPLKGGIWNSNWQLFPVPLNDIQTNNKITQNSGY